MRSVFSIEPEGMTRAWPIVPLISRKARPTQNHASTSRCTRLPMGSLGSSAAFPVSFPASLPLGCCLASAFTFHRHWLFDRCVFRSAAIFRFRSVSVALADFQLHKVRRIDPGITRRTELAFGVIHGLA